MTNQYFFNAGTPDVSVVIRIADATDGTPETGVTAATPGLDLRYRRELGVAVAITEVDLVALDDPHTDGGLLHIGAGYYRLDLPDAAVAGGSSGALVFGSVTGMVVFGAYVHLAAGPAEVIVAGANADTLTASALAADAVAEIAAAIVTNGPLDAARVDVVLSTRATQVTADAIETDTQDIQGRLPAALTAGGRMDADATAISGSTAAADAVEANIDNLDVLVSTRATEANVDAVGSAVVAVIADTEDIQARLPAALVGGRIDASVGAIDATATAAIVDRLLGRSIAGGADGGRTVTSTLRRVRNRNTIAAGTLTTYQEDDATPDHTAAVVTAVGNPVSSIDPT